MNFDDPKFTEIHHRNVWGEWTLVFEGTTLCSLKFQGSSNSKERLFKPGETSTSNKITACNLQACAYAASDRDIHLHGKIAQAYRKVVTQLMLYLSGKIREFTIPIKIYGTDFQREVLEVAQKIPYGQTWTYKEITEFIGRPKAERAVGNALHNNPLQVIIPCHRVISARGKLSGYALGTSLKRRLLCMEGAIQNELELD